MLKAWTTLSSETLVKDPWMDLRRQRVATGKGVILESFYVIAYPDWAVTVAITPERELVLVRQYRQGIGSFCLELPGGVVDPGEDPHQASLRELREETGYEGTQARAVGCFAANPGTQTNFIHVSVVRDAKPVHDHHHEAGEELTVELVPLSDLARLLADPAFCQSMHVGCLAAALLSEGLLVQNL